MSGFLAATLLLLLLGTLITTVLAWLLRRYHHELAAGVALIAVLVWLLVGRNLPQAVASGSLSLQVDQTAWQLSLYVLLLALAALIRLLVPAAAGESPLGASFSWLARPPAIMLLTTTTLLSLWSASLPGLLTLWTLLALTWMLLLALEGAGKAGATRLLMRGSAMLLSLVFLWLAAVALGPSGQSGLDMASWPAQARTWILLAAVTQLGALPLQWWRPLKRPLPPASAALIHLMPAVAGGSLLARLAMNYPAGLGYALFLTTFGLVGFLVAVSRAWINLGRPGIVVANLALGQASAVLLASAWVGSEAIVAEVGVLALAFGGLFLASDALEGGLAWLRAPAIAAIAGIPLTAGFIGLATLYSNWSTAGLFLLLLVSALLYIPLLAAAILAPWRKVRVSNEGGRDLRATAPIIAGQLLLAVGLVAVPIPLAGQTPPLAWLAILLAAAGGLGLSRQTERIQEAPAGLQRAFHLELSGGRLERYAAALGSVGGHAIREAAAILEGEGGLLWLVVLLVVIWLASIG